MKTEYKDRLLKSFPKDIKSEIEAVLDILPFQNSNVTLCDGQVYYVNNLIHPDEITIQLNNEELRIPDRLYFDEPNIELEDKLSEKQKTILNCIYLRHHNGYIREKRLKKLIGENEYWITPFTIQLLGEYVYEILIVLNDIITVETIESYQSFIEENPRYWQITESRMISYWNEYYRREFPKLNDYLGIVLVKRIKTNVQLRTHYHIGPDRLG